MELSYSCKEPKSRDAENKLLPHLTPSFLVLKKKKKENLSPGRQMPRGVDNPGAPESKGAELLCLSSLRRPRRSDQVRRK
jgi:hypothetical protein